MRWLRSVWTRLRGGEPCYVCGRSALTAAHSGWYTGREKFIHAEHLIAGVLSDVGDKT